jgi:hypothetical protein
VALAFAAVGVGETPDAGRRRQVASTLTAVRVGTTPDAGRRGHVTDAVRAGRVLDAVDAPAGLGVADAPTEAVAIARTLYARIRLRVAHRAGRALLATAALDAPALAGQTNAEVAVPVVETVHALTFTQVASPRGALCVGRALYAAAAREVAHPGLALVVREASDAGASDRITALAFTTLRVFDALSTQPAQLRSTALGGRADVVGRVTLGHTAPADRVADLAGIAAHLGACRAGRAQPVGGHTLRRATLEADGAGTAFTAAGAAKSTVRQGDAAVRGASAVVIGFTGGAGPLAVGFALARVGVAVRARITRGPPAAIESWVDAVAGGEVTALVEGAVVCRSAAPQRQLAAPEHEVADAGVAGLVGRALRWRGVALTPRLGGVWAVFGRLVGARHGQDRDEDDPQPAGKERRDDLHDSGDRDGRGTSVRHSRRGDWNVHTGKACIRCMEAPT